MGCFDTIFVFMRCPYCKEYQSFDCQTKDIGSLMYNYDALSEDWFKKPKASWRDMRKKLPVFPCFPADKSHKVWKNQAEKMEASAKVHPDYKHLKVVEVIVTCHSNKCQAFADERDIRQQGCPSGFGRAFYGKVRIHKGFFMGKVYDIELTDKRLPRKPRGKK